MVQRYVVEYHLQLRLHLKQDLLINTKGFVVNHYHQQIELCVRVLQLLINGAAYFDNQKLYAHHKLLGYIHI